MIPVSRSNSQSFDVVTIGSSNQDLVIRVPHIPVAGETILGNQSGLFLGGKGANQAVAAMRGGGRVLFITKVGKDLFGQNMMTHFYREGFPAEGILVDSNELTGMAQIWVAESGENAITVAPGANSKLLPADLEEFTESIRLSGVVLMQLEIPMETVSRAVELAWQGGVKVILNPAPAQLLNPDLLRRVWLLTPNESEATLLTGVRVDGVESAKNAGQKLLQQGVQNVIITLGERGSVFCHGKGSRHFDAYQVEAVDSTAAGDVFNGFVAVAIASGKNLEDAIPFASAAAALSVGRPGAQVSIPTFDEVHQFMKAQESSEISSN